MIKHNSEQQLIVAPNDTSKYTPRPKPNIIDNKEIAQVVMIIWSGLLEIIFALSGGIVKRAIDKSIPDA